MSQVHVELLKLCEMLSPDVKANVLALASIPAEILGEEPDIRHFLDPEPRPMTEYQDYGDLYEEALKVKEAIARKETANLLAVDSILGNNRPAKILNVVASIKLCDDINLGQIADNSWNVEYNRSQFSGLVIQVSEPKATGVVYSTGRMIVTGARSEADCREAAHYCMQVIRDAGCHITGEETYRIQNICATTQLGYRVRIHEMGANKELKMSGKLINFTPEIFSGLVCNFENPKVTVVCFATGTLLFSGAHKEEDIQIALFRFRALSFPYKH